MVSHIFLASRLALGAASWYDAFMYMIVEGVAVAMPLGTADLCAFCSRIVGRTAGRACKFECFVWAEASCQSRGGAMHVSA